LTTCRFVETCDVESHIYREPSLHTGNSLDLRRAFGHVGFTGTSLWIDPERDRYFVLLTNRACGGGTIEEMRTVRRAFHDALGDI